MNLNTALDGLLDAEARLTDPATMMSPSLLSEQMYRLGQYTSAVEKELGDLEKDYEIDWADEYKSALIGEKEWIKDPNYIPTSDATDTDTVGETVIRKPMSTTAAKNHADMETAEMKGQIKRLSRYVSSAWKVHMSAMARIKHLESENKGSV